MTNSLPHRLQVDGAGVAVEQAVERTVAKGRGENAPQTNEQKQDFDLHRRKKINDKDARAEHSTQRSFPSTDVLHLLQNLRVSLLMHCLPDNANAHPASRAMRRVEILDELDVGVHQRCWNFSSEESPLHGCSGPQRR